MSTESWLQTKRIKRGTQARLGRTALALFLWGATAEGTSALGSDAGNPSRNPVRIQSEQLVAEMGADTAEFSGAVRVEGDGYTVTADYLTIQFRPGTVGGDRPAETITAKEISRITARGQVRIRTDTLTASSEQAVYEPDSGQIWLLAPDAAPPVRAPQRGQRKAAPGERAAQASGKPSSAQIRLTLLPTAVR
jgi:lipopolysaccharide export system protein LptA